MKFLIYTALFSVLFSLFSRLMVCVDYFVRKDYYAEVLCENKEEPECCCEGKCAMGKQLISLDEKEQSQPSDTKNPVLKLNKVEEALCSTFRSFIVRMFLGTVVSAETTALQEGIHESLFHPPCPLI